MQTKSSQFQSWDDLVFENRNREYGAYAIRKAYSRRVIIGWGITMMLMALLFTIAGVAPKTPAEIVKPLIPERGVVKLIEVPALPRKSMPQHTRKPKTTPSRKTVPLVVQHQVTEPPAEVEAQYIEPTEGSVAGEGSLSGTGTAAIETPAVLPATGPLDRAEVMPEYEGGFEAIMKKIQKHIRYPAAARRLGIEGAVYVRFVVNGDGTVSNIEVLRGIHPDCDKEASRVIALLNKWKGGKQNGMPVAVRMVLPIKFALQK